MSQLGEAALFGIGLVDEVRLCYHCRYDCVAAYFCY